MGKLFILAFALIFAFGYENLGDTDGTWSLLGFTGYAGEIVINNLTGSSLFYWLFQASQGNITSDKLPIILWLQGGQGCSGSTGMVFENIGPFGINNNTQPVINPYTWISNYHVIMVDFPIGAGYSVANSPNDLKNTTMASVAYLYNFLVKLSLKYPTWFNRDLYIFGESYSGHFIPGIAYTILMNNKSPNAQKVFSLKGVAIGDPWIEAYTQTQYYAEYAYSCGLIDNEEKGIIENYQQEIIVALNASDYNKANNADLYLEYELFAKYSGNADPFNVRYFYDNYDLGQVPAWMNLASTKTMLHAPLNVTWVSCNGTIGNAWTVDIMSSMANYLPFILDNIRVLIWNGQDDFDVTNIGTQALLAKLNWQNIKGFVNARKHVWKVNKEVAGYAISYNNLSFALTLKAGHLFSHDQPQSAKDLVIRFINNQGFK